jgi:hypothetical protein
MDRKKANTLIVLIIIGGAAGTGGFLAWYFLTGQNYPACTTATPFTAFPVDMARIKSIAPLGNLNPPGHTFPTDHMYFYKNDSLTDFQVFAPGNITITRLATVHYDPPQGGISDDYTIEFRVCRELSGKFGHVNNLSALLWGKISPFGSAGDQVQTWTVAGRTYTSYQKSVSFSVAAGDLLGTAGLGGGYDFWLKDTRVTMTWVNQAWPREFQNTVCPQGGHGSVLAGLRAEPGLPRELRRQGRLRRRGHCARHLGARRLHVLRLHPGRGHRARARVR